MTGISKFRRTALTATLTILLVLQCWGQQSRTAVIDLDPPNQPVPSAPPNPSSKETRTGIIYLDPPDKPAPSTPPKITSPTEPEPEIIYVAPNRAPKAAQNVTSTQDSQAAIIDRDTPLEMSKLPPGATRPKLIHRVEPEFSQEAREKHIEGTVVLSVVISAEGKVAEVHVVKGVGHGLNEKAIQAVRQWKFQPARIDGKPIAVNVRVEMSFRLY